ncbi:MAG TPA: DNA polymerase III subunit gamma/tau, partial [Clostridiaceae bacterium]|nr:DNA polymerase III subunit gamma/tau [Clostridiaceae bacterium]
LFCGTRGTGKTTLAKILANAINCLSPVSGNPCGTCEVCRGVQAASLMDIIEIDAASNNSVDNIRRITDEVLFLPTLTKYKVYIIDEVHMLSGGAFNALLKTLEEPPAHAVFILATTEVHRIPATITSRCQRFDFRRISAAAMDERLQKIADSENIDIDTSAIAEIIRQSDGALRDAISLIDQCHTGIVGHIDRQAVRNLIGVVDLSFIGSLVASLQQLHTESILQHIETVVQEGKDIIRFTSDIIQYYRDLMICKVSRNPSKLVDASPAEIKQMMELTGGYEQCEIVSIIKHLSELISDLKWVSNPRTLLEVNLLSLAGTRHGNHYENSTAVESKSLRQSATDNQQVAQHSPLTVASPGQPSIQQPAFATEETTPRQQPAAVTQQRSTELQSDPATGKQGKLQHEEPEGSLEEQIESLEELMQEQAQRTKLHQTGNRQQTTEQHPLATPTTGKQTAQNQASGSTLSSVSPGASSVPSHRANIDSNAAGAVASPDNPPLVAPDEPVDGHSPLWTNTLEILKEKDTFIYCFAVAALVSGTGKQITLRFNSSSKQNYSILTEQRGNRPLREALQRANNGHAVELNIVANGFATDTENTTAKGAPGTEWQTELQANLAAIGLEIEREVTENG